jgi:hypothetical protein
MPVGALVTGASALGLPMARAWCSLAGVLASRQLDECHRLSLDVSS